MMKTESQKEIFNKESGQNINNKKEIKYKWTIISPVLN